MSLNSRLYVAGNISESKAYLFAAINFLMPLFAFAS